MRILITTDTVGGVWSFTRDLGTELLARGHALLLVSFGRFPSPEQRAWCDAQLEAHAERFTFAASDVPLEWMQNNEQALSAGDAVLATAAARFAPDLLLANQFCFGASSLLVPRVVVAHSDVLSWAAAAKPAALEPTPWLNQYTSMVQRGLLQADVLVTPTRAMLGAIKRSFFLTAPTATIPNGCAPCSAHAPAQRTLQAVSAGRLWDEAKGLEILHDCELPIPVLVAGETSFESATAPVPQMPNVSWLGAKTSEELRQIFAESSIYLCTSHYEPFGLAPLEAAACGCAVVARDLPSLREVWGDAALFFKDSAELSAILRRLASQPVFLVEAQRRSSHRAAQYTLARTADGYLTIFDHVLKQRRSMPDVA